MLRIGLFTLFQFTLGTLRFHSSGFVQPATLIRLPKAPPPLPLLGRSPLSTSLRQVAKVVAPKKAKLEEMNSLLAAANATLAIKQARLLYSPVLGCPPWLRTVSSLHKHLSKVDHACGLVWGSLTKTPAGLNGQLAINGSCANRSS